MTCPRSLHPNPLHLQCEPPTLLFAYRSPFKHSQHSPRGPVTSLQSRGMAGDLRNEQQTRVRRIEISLGRTLCTAQQASLHPGNSHPAGFAFVTRTNRTRWYLYACDTHRPQRKIRFRSKHPGAKTPASMASQGLLGWADSISTSNSSPEINQHARLILFASQGFSHFTLGSGHVFSLRRFTASVRFVKAYRQQPSDFRPRFTRVTTGDEVIPKVPALGMSLALSLGL